VKKETITMPDGSLLTAWTFERGDKIENFVFAILQDVIKICKEIYER
jgi:hypothetical protein